MPSRPPLPTDLRAVKPGMTRVVVLYPDGPHKTFHVGYYVNRHLPLLAELLGSPLVAMSMDRGLAGDTPELPPPFLAIGSFYFATYEAYREGFVPHLPTLRMDHPNFTNILPIIHVGVVL